MGRYINIDVLIDELEDDHPYNWCDSEWERGLVSGYELALSIVKDQPITNFLQCGYVPLGAYQQVAWERDVAIDQLNSYGVQFGEKAELQRVKHGKWFLLDECSNHGVYCSVCYKKVYKDDYANQKLKSKYCPNCGARMDEK